MSKVPCPNVACSNKELKRGDIDQFGYDGFSCLECGGEYSFPYSIGYFDGASNERSKIEIECDEKKYNTTIIMRKFKVGHKLGTSIKEFIDSLYIPSDRETELENQLEKSEALLRFYSHGGNPNRDTSEIEGRGYFTGKAARQYFQDKKEQEGETCSNG